MSKWRINGAQIFRTSLTDKIELWVFRSLGSFSIVGQDVTKSMTFILAVNVADGQFLAVSLSNTANYLSFKELARALLTQLIFTRFRLN